MEISQELKQLYRQLLSDPRTKIKPEWAEGGDVVKYIHLNMGEFLLENPHTFPLVAKYKEHVKVVSYALPLNDDELIRGTLRNMATNPENLIHRLAAVGKADLLVELSPSVLAQGDVFKYVSQMQSSTVLRLLQKTKYMSHEYDRRLLYIGDAVKKLNSDELMQFIWGPDRTNVDVIVRYCVPSDVTHIMQILPLSYAKRFVEEYVAIRGEFACPCCDKVYKSSQSLKLHRKHCDWGNEHPTVQEILAKRLEEAGQAA